MASFKEPARGDCLIWIGGSYPTIADFVAEARKLGCCRQVPFWPSWLRPGSRVFLAHRGGLTETEQGVVFGYFKLGGVDVVLSPGDYEEYVGCKTPGDKIDFWKERPHGLPVRPARPSSGGSGDPLTEFIADFVLGCETDRPGFGNGLSTNQTALAGARDCGVDGLRRGPELPGGDGHPTFYLVDELEREITNELCEALEKLIEEMLKRDRKKTRADCLRELRPEARKELGKHKRQAGLPSFTRAVERVGGRRRTKGRRRTEALVLFPEPYPMFERAPHASFRGVLRVDGDDLLAQVRALRPGRRGRIRIPYHGVAPSIIGTIASNLGWNEARARSVAHAIRDALRNAHMAVRPRTGMSACPPWRDERLFTAPLRR